MIEQITIKGNPSYINLTIDVFDKLREYLSKQYVNKGYGWLISTRPVKPVFHSQPYGIYQLTNIIPTYIENNLLLENIGEYNEYLQLLSLYNQNLETELKKILNKINIEIISIED